MEIKLTQELARVPQDLLAQSTLQPWRIIKIPLLELVQLIMMLTDVLSLEEASGRVTT
jgi:hypothetical protein